MIGATMLLAGSKVLGGSHPFHPTSAEQLLHSGRRACSFVKGANKGEFPLYLPFCPAGTGGPHGISAGLNGDRLALQPSSGHQPTRVDNSPGVNESIADVALLIPSSPQPSAALRLGNLM